MAERDQGQDDFQPNAVVRVSSLELFSDLVFVFAVTRLTTVLVNDPTWTGLSHVLLLFGVIWWIYGGYIWLTNAVRPDRPIRKLLLLGAMAGFLIMGLAIPRAFEGDGVVFGIGYLVVVVIHTGLFTQAAGVSRIAGVVRVAPFNLASAVLLIIAGSLSGAAETVLWVVALSIQVVSPFIARTESFRIEPSHFVERYGLLVLIILGESILAVGAGGKNTPLSAALVGTSVLGLALTAALWWAYFEGDLERAEVELRATPVTRRPARALAAFFYAQIPMFLGVVAIAAAIKTSLPQPTAAAAQSQAWLLAGGAAAFLAGDLWFRSVLDIPRGIWRMLATPAALVTAVVGLTFSTAAQLAVLDAMLIAALIAESRGERRYGTGAETPVNRG
jgi:low temperature requirement protein LtrA